MPQSEYYGGHGSEVMKKMKQRYGEKKGKSVFYATANKRGMKPGGGQHKAPSSFKELAKKGR